MVKKVIVGLALIFSTIFGYSEAQAVHPPYLSTPWPSWKITSSYGPRDSSGTYFHMGIDYGGPFGADIPTIESGYITGIGHASRGGYYIKYKSNKFYAESGNVPNEWIYFHMFSDDSKIVTSTKWEYVPGDPSTSYTFINPMNSNDRVTNKNIIIKWFNKDTQQAAQVLCVLDYDGYYVQDSMGHDILSPTGDRLAAKGIFNSCINLGPVGSSKTGTTPHPHLHVALNNQSDNPLFYLAHGNHGYPTSENAKFTIPADSVSISPLNENALTYRLKSDIITSRNKNYDLDKVEFLIDGNLLSNNNTDTNLPGYSTLKSKFVFGGLPDVNPNGTPYPDWITSKSRMSSNDTVTGVRPLKDSDSTPTNFRFIWNADLCNLPPGDHRFTVKAVDVNGYITTNGTDFTIGVVVGTNPGDDYSTIQAAINAAGTDCKSRKITVRDGRYVEHIDYKGKAVWLRSEHGADHTTIDGSGGVVAETFTYSAAYTPIYEVTMLVERLNGSVVTFANSEMHSSILDGFTIANGSGTTSTFLQIHDNGYGISSYRWPEINGGGIYCASSSPTINNCIINKLG